MMLLLAFLACGDPAPGPVWSAEAITAEHRAAAGRVAGAAPMTAQEMLAQLDALDPQTFDGGPPRRALDLKRWRDPFVGNAQARHAAEVMLFLRAELGSHPGLPTEVELRAAAQGSTDGWPPEGPMIGRLKAAYAEKGWGWPLQ